MSVTLFTMGSSQTRPIKVEVDPSSIVDYSVQFVVRTSNSDAFQYIRNSAILTECIEGVMNFANSLEKDTPYFDHVPVYNLKYRIEARDADIYRVTITWSSESCKEEYMRATLKWFIEKEIRRCIKVLYGVKPLITVKNLKILGPTLRPLVAVGHEAVIRRNLANM